MKRVNPVGITVAAPNPDAAYGCESIPLDLFAFLFKHGIMGVLLLFVLVPGVIADESEPARDYFKIVFSPSQVKQGQSFTVFLDSTAPIRSIKVSGLDRELHVYRIWRKGRAHLYRGFAGVPATQQAGSYKIMAQAVDDRKETLTIYAMLDVLNADYPIQRVQLSKQKFSLLNNEELQKEGKILGSKLELRNQKVFFSSHFILPAEGRISSPFGARRQYNDEELSSYHKGIDIANQTGTKVKAANGGKVSLAMDLKSNGKIILINHGHGVTSIYSHLDVIKVKEGQWVKQGLIIGEIGSTGISSGPHLHFGLSVNNVRVDPLQWLNSDIVLYYNKPSE